MNVSLSQPQTPNALTWISGVLNKQPTPPANLSNTKLNLFFYFETQRTMASTLPAGDPSSLRSWLIIRKGGWGVGSLELGEDNPRGHFCTLNWLPSCHVFLPSLGVMATCRCPIFCHHLGSWTNVFLLSALLLPSTQSHSYMSLPTYLSVLKNVCKLCQSFHGLPKIYNYYPRGKRLKWSLFCSFNLAPSFISFKWWCISSRIIKLKILWLDSPWCKHIQR